MNLRNLAVLALFPLSVVFLSGCTVHAHAGPRSAGAPAQAGPRVIGERVVNGAADHDTIEGLGDGRFHAIQIDVDGSALEMFDVVVTFGDGDRFSPPTRLVFDNNTRSRVIDLPGGDRLIRRIDFRYGNLPGGGRAHVTVSGI
jgi:hypothetical protein